MALSPQDFQRAIDLTGINPINGGDLNNLVDQTIPFDENGTGTGKGLTLYSKDTAQNVPDVPDANTNIKWQRYLWIRKPYITGTADDPKLYAWNPFIGQDPVFLGWREVLIDTTTLQAAINAAVVTANNALTTANQANATAVAANNAAGNAVLTSNDADTNASNALAAATGAQGTATNALNIANQALDRSGTYVKVSEAVAKGTNGAQIATLSNAIIKSTRPLNTIDFNQGVLVSLNAGTGVITFIVAGKYRVKAHANLYHNGGGADGVAHQLLVVKDSDNSTLLTGNPLVNSGGLNMQTVSFVEGELTVNANDTIRLDHYSKMTAANSTTRLGLAANIHPDAGGKEVYSVIELTKLN